MKSFSLVSLARRTLPCWIFLLGSISLALWTRVGGKALPIILIATVFIFVLQSITRFVMTVVIALLGYSALLGLIDVIGLDHQWVYPYNLLGQLIFGAFFLVVIKLYRVNISWPVDTAAALLSVAGAFLLADRDVFQTGHAIAALFPNEDNAAWILTLHRATSENSVTAGDFGPLFDLLLYSSNRFINFVLPDGLAADNFANSIIVLHLAVLLIVPFAAVAVLNHISGNSLKFRDHVSKVFFLALGSQVVWIHFITSGHASTGLSSILILMLLVLLSFKSPSSSTTDLKSTLLWVLITFAATSIWFPIAPFSLSLLILIGIRKSRVSNRRITSFNLLTVLAGSILIISRELLPRFDTFRTEESSLLSGAFNLLKMEGGVGSTGPYSFAWVLMFLLVLVAFNPLGENYNQVVRSLTPIIVGFLTVVGLKIVNLRSSGGAVNYGARKYESVLIIISLVLFGLILINRLSSRMASNGLMVLTFGLGISLFAQLPAVEQFLSGRTYFATKDAQQVQLGRAIANNLSVGDDVVCINEPAQFDRYLTYRCSRWTSAYADKDDLIKNEWRKAVLGELPLDAMPKIRSDLGSSTKLIVLGDAVNMAQRNPEWDYLVDSKWETIFARDN